MTLVLAGHRVAPLPPPPRRHRRSTVTSVELDPPAGQHRPADIDLLVLAELNCDVVVACDADTPRFGQVEQLVSHAELTVGSSGAITASAAAALGASVAVCGVVGDDELGRQTLALLRARDVDVDGVVRRAGHRTGLTVVLSRPGGDRALLTFPGTMAELGADDLVPPVLSRARHVHVSSPYLQRRLLGDLPGILRTARDAGATTSLDPGWDPDEEWTRVAGALPELDLLLPNAAEAVAMARALGLLVGPLGEVRDDHPEPVAEAALALSRLGPVVAVKNGSSGALLATGGTLTEVLAVAVDPVDTTGAGDNVDAGMIVALLEGADQITALARGVACGTISVGGWGGTGCHAGLEAARTAAAELSIRSLVVAPVRPHTLESA